MTNNTEAAYAAGILDGEGSILLTRNRRTRLVSPRVDVASTDRELLMWLKQRWGGVINRKRTYAPQHSASYTWKLTDRKALGFLKAVRPYMIIRRKISRAELLLNEYLGCTPRNGRYTAEMLKKKQQLIEDFSSLP